MADTFERVMVIVAHPDDAESWVGGTVTKLAREGETVSYVIVTNGDTGSADRSMSPHALARISASRRRFSVCGTWSSSATRTATWRTRGLCGLTSHVSFGASGPGSSCSRMRGRAAEVGRKFGFAYAESFDRI